MGFLMHVTNYVARVNSLYMKNLEVFKVVITNKLEDLLHDYEVL